MNCFIDCSTEKIYFFVEPLLFPTCCHLEPAPRAGEARYQKFNFTRGAGQLAGHSGVVTRGDIKTHVLLIPCRSTHSARHNTWGQEWDDEVERFVTWGPEARLGAVPKWQQVYKILIIELFVLSVFL